MKKLTTISILGALAAFGLMGCAELLPHYTDPELLNIASEGTQVPAKDLSVIPGTIMEDIIAEDDYGTTKAVDFQVNTVRGAEYRCNFTWREFAFTKTYNHDVQCIQINAPAPTKAKKRSSKSSSKKMKDG